MNIHIKAKRFLILSPTQEFTWLTNHILAITPNGQISRFIPQNEFKGEITKDYSNYDIVPGLIDFHIHGCAGSDTMHATPKAFATMSNFLASHGVVAFQATTVTNTKEKIAETLAAIENIMENQPPGAQILGAYMEGPFFTEQHRGAHPLSLLIDPEITYLNELLQKYPNVLKTIAIAPEKPSITAIIKFLAKNNVNVMLGHGNADYETTKSALEAGAKGIVHCYNGMSGLHHREPGMVGAGLTSKHTFVEIICDGFHVHPAAVDIVYRCTKDKNRMLLITDAMEATGMPDGQYTLGEYKVNMSKGVVKLDNGSLAGSTLTLNQAVFNIMQWLNLSLPEAWYMASYIPAKLLGITDKLGSLAIGRQASFVVLDQQEIKSTWIQGQEHIKN